MYRKRKQNFWKPLKHKLRNRYKISLERCSVGMLFRNFGKHRSGVQFTDKV